MTNEQKSCKVFHEMFSLLLKTVLLNWQNKFGFISHHLFFSFTTISTSRLPLLTSTYRKWLLILSLLSKKITKHLDISLSPKVNFYSLHNHLVFEWCYLHSYSFFWLMKSHSSGVNPNKWLWLMYLPSQLHPGWQIASPAGQTDPVTSTCGSWAITIQPEVLLYLTCSRIS